MFNVPATVLKDGKTWDAYLGERADKISWCWEPARPCYVDVHDLDLELRTSTGKQPIEFLISRLNDRGSCAIPVTGTEADRGPEYLEVVRRLVSRYRRGVGLRLVREELEEPRVLEESVAHSLAVLGVAPSDCDLFVDFGFVGKDRLEVLQATAVEALALLGKFGLFRNTAFGGSSIPDQLGKRDHRIVRREKRIELGAWTQINEIVEGRDRIAVAFIDYGVVGAHYVPPSNSVRTPSRIRYTTLLEHVFRRANRNEHAELCRQLVATSDYVGPMFSDGDRRIDLSARGLCGPGAPAVWIACDTNHHLELVSDQAWSTIRKMKLDGEFSLPEPLLRPWLQAELLTE